MGNKASKPKTPGDGGTVVAPPTRIAPPVAPVAEAPAPKDVATITDAVPQPEAKLAEASAPSESASPASEQPMSPDDKKTARKSHRLAKEQEKEKHKQEKEKEKQEKKRKEKEEKAMKEAEKRMVSSSKRKSVKSTQELRQESHEKVADVMAFLNDVEKGKTEEDPIAMLDSLIEEDKNAKAAESAEPDPVPIAATSPAEEGPRDLVAMLEKLQKLIEDPQMLQRLEELVGAKLTSENDPTKLKSMSNDEMEKLELAMARDSEWAKRRRAEREEEVKKLTAAVSLADKRKSYLATSSGDQTVEKKSAQVALPSGAGSVSEKRRSLLLNNSEVNTALKKQTDSSVAKDQGPGSLRKAVDSPPVAELKSAMKKGDSPQPKRRGIQFAAADAPEEKRTPSGKRMPLEGRTKAYGDGETSPKKLAIDASPAPLVETEDERAKRESDEKEAQEKVEKEAENKAKLAAYKLELEEKKRRGTSEMRRRAMEKLATEST